MDLVEGGSSKVAYNYSQQHASPLAERTEARCGYAQSLSQRHVTLLPNFETRLHDQKNAIHRQYIESNSNIDLTRS